MTQRILAAETRLAELDQNLVQLEKEKMQAATIVAVCGGGTVAAFILSALWIF